MVRRKQEKPVRLEDVDTPTTSSTSAQTERTASRKRKLDEPSSERGPLAALEESLLKLRPQKTVEEPHASAVHSSKNGRCPVDEPSTSTNENLNRIPSDGLCSLYKFVSSMAEPEKEPRRVVGSTNAILRCLECGAAFGHMEQLVVHMTTTRHFASLTRRSNSWLPAAPKKPEAPRKIAHTPSPKPINQPAIGFPSSLFNSLIPKHLRLMCAHCGDTEADIVPHLKKQHSIEVRDLPTWLVNIRLIPGDSQNPSPSQHQPDQISPHLSQLMMMIDSVNK
ncbi:unnamed protein product, partial [Mesorhabditis spiculigera]